jgi:RNA polymerase sigma-70 factor, ECF subfamily
MLTNVLERGAHAPSERDSGEDVGLLVPHLKAAHSLARCLIRDDSEAEDAVQEAYLRACEHFRSFQGGNGRSWFLAIVRNCCYDHLKSRSSKAHVEFDEETQSGRGLTLNPQSSLLQQEQISRVVKALTALPVHLCEVLVFREFEDMSYSEIAAHADIPIGTVMSRLSRARHMLRRLLFMDASSEQAL